MGPSILKNRAYQGPNISILINPIWINPEILDFRKQVLATIAGKENILHKIWVATLIFMCNFCHAPILQFQSSHNITMLLPFVLTGISCYFRLWRHLADGLSSYNVINPTSQPDVRYEFVRPVF